MTNLQRITTALAASAFTIGLAGSPAAFAAEAMSPMHDGMHKGMKPQKRSMTKKHDSMMKKDDAMMKKDGEPAQ